MKAKFVYRDVKTYFNSLYKVELRKPSNSQFSRLPIDSVFSIEPEKLLYKRIVRQVIEGKGCNAMEYDGEFSVNIKLDTVVKWYQVTKEGCIGERSRVEIGD